MQASRQHNFASQRSMTKARVFHKDAVQSLQWLRKAADQGFPRGQAWLADLYRDGTALVPQDYKLAMEWSRKAADQGDSFSDMAIARMYTAGMGVPQDNRQAEDWLKKAREADAKIRPLGCSGVPPGCGTNQLSVASFCGKLEQIKAVLGPSK